MLSYRHVVIGGFVFVTTVFFLTWTVRTNDTGFLLIPNVVPFAIPRPADFYEGNDSTISKLEENNSTISKPVDNNDVPFRRIRDVTALHARFSNLTLDSCHNSCEEIHTHCQSTRLEQWLKIFKRRNLTGVPLFSEHEYFFPWEPQYLRTPPLEDIKALPSLNLSKVYYNNYFRGNDQQKTTSNVVFSSNQDRRDVLLLTLNEPAYFRVDLVDGYGRPRGIGGDEVRAWLKGQTDGDPRPEVLWATAMVKDLGNGSYDVIATPTWTGIAKLNVAVSYPREYIRATVHHFRIGVHRFIFGGFKRGDIAEVTLCHSTPNVPGRHCLCNMTRVNSLPYYCGRPLDSRLSCSDWVKVNTVPRPGFRDMTAAEITMDKAISRHPNASLIRPLISIRITRGNNESEVILPPCRLSGPRTSWTKMSPRGTWSKGKTLWNSLICREPPMSQNWIATCLKSTKVWMIGDSNIRHMAMRMCASLGLDERTHNSWPETSVCRNERYDITVQFRPHEYPLYVANRWLDLLNNGAVIDTISSIPSTGNHILVFHYFLHFSSSHLNVLEQRLRILKTAISELLSRNPRVLVGIRGPHTSSYEWRKNHMFGGDVLGVFIRQIYIDTFWDLQDKVVFLDGWDMSISYENLYFHPYPSFINAMWRTLLAYKCD